MYGMILEEKMARELETGRTGAHFAKKSFLEGCRKASELP